MARYTKDITEYETEAGEDELQLSLLFRHLPVAVLKATHPARGSRRARALAPLAFRKTRREGAG